MKLTPELKERYFAAHWGQRVLIALDEDNDIYVVNASSMQPPIEDCYLELFDLADIADEDALEVWTIYGKCNLSSVKRSENGWWLFRDKASPEFVYDVDLTVKQGDFLRSRSYALPFEGIPVSELIKAGWLKIRKTPHQ